MINKRTSISEPPKEKSSVSLATFASKVVSSKKSEVSIEEPPAIRLIPLVSASITLPQVAVMDPDPCKSPPIEIDLGGLAVETNIYPQYKLPPSDLECHGDVLGASVLESFRRVSPAVVAYHAAYCEGSLRTKQVLQLPSPQQVRVSPVDLTASVQFWLDLALAPKSLSTGGVREPEMPVQTTGSSRMPTQMTDTSKMPIQSTNCGPLPTVPQARRFIIAQAHVPPLRVHPLLWRAVKANREVLLKDLSRTVPLRSTGNTVMEEIMGERVHQKRADVQDGVQAIHETAGLNTHNSANIRTFAEQLQGSRGSTLGTRFEAIKKAPLSRSLIETFIPVPHLIWETGDSLEARQDIVWVVHVNAVSAVLADIDDAEVLSMSAEKITITQSGVTHTFRMSLGRIEVLEYVSSATRDPQAILCFKHEAASEGNGPDECDILWETKPCPVSELAALEAMEGEMFSESVPESSKLVIHPIFNKQEDFQRQRLQASTVYPSTISSLQIKQPSVAIHPTFFGVIAVLLSEHMSGDGFRSRAESSALIGSILDSRVINAVTGVSLIDAAIPGGIAGGVDRTRTQTIRWASADDVHALKDSIIKSAVEPASHGLTDPTLSMWQMDVQSVATLEHPSLADDGHGFGNRSDSSGTDQEMRTGSIEPSNDEAVWQSFTSFHYPEGWRQAVQRGVLYHDWIFQASTFLRSLTQDLKASSSGQQSLRYSFQKFRNKRSFMRASTLFRTSPHHVASRGPDALLEEEERFPYGSLHDLARAVAQLDTRGMIKLLEDVRARDKRPKKLTLRSAYHLNNTQLRIDRISCRLMVPGKFHAGVREAGNLNCNTIYTLSAALKVDITQKAVQISKLEELADGTSEAVHSNIPFVTLINVHLEDATLQSRVMCSDAAGPRTRQELDYPMASRMDNDSRCLWKKFSLQAFLRMLDPVAAKLYLESMLTESLIAESDSSRKFLVPVEFEVEERLPHSSKLKTALMSKQVPLWNPVSFITAVISPMQVTLTSIDVACFQALLNWVKINEFHTSLDLSSSGSQSHQSPSRLVLTDKHSSLEHWREIEPMEVTSVYTKMLADSGEPLLFKAGSPGYLPVGTVLRLCDLPASVKSRNLPRSLRREDAVVIPHEPTGTESSVGCSSFGFHRTLRLIKLCKPLKLVFTFNAAGPRPTGKVAVSEFGDPQFRPVLRFAGVIRDVAFFPGANPAKSVFSSERDPLWLWRLPHFYQCGRFDAQMELKSARQGVKDWEALVDPVGIRATIIQRGFWSDARCDLATPLMVSLGVTQIQTLMTVLQVMARDQKVLITAVDKRKGQFWRRILRANPLRARPSRFEESPVGDTMLVPKLEFQRTECHTDTSVAKLSEASPASLDSTVPQAESAPILNHPDVTDDSRHRSFAGGSKLSQQLSGVPLRNIRSFGSLNVFPLQGKLSANSIVKVGSDSLILRNRSSLYMVLLSSDRSISALMAPEDVVPLSLENCILTTAPVRIYFFVSKPNLPPGVEIEDYARESPDFFGLLADAEFQRFTETVVFPLSAPQSASLSEIATMILVVQQVTLKREPDGNVAINKASSNGTFLLDFVSALSVANNSGLSLEVSAMPIFLDSDERPAFGKPRFIANLRAGELVPRNCCGIPYSVISPMGCEISFSQEIAVKMAPSQSFEEDSSRSPAPNMQTEVAKGSATITWPQSLDETCSLWEHQLIRFPCRRNAHYLSAIRLSEVFRVAKHLDDALGGAELPRLSRRRRAKAMTSKLMVCAPLMVANNLPFPIQLVFRNMKPRERYLEKSVGAVDSDEMSDRVMLDVGACLPVHSIDPSQPIALAVANGM
eukprot:Gregarina_sp_Poly_1__9016@NODE_54_length_17501_cov_44_565045_g46_i0_p2_GENE_NODE_54_length_17501_cov_44_565045_g46_i0NODE_54_length_17501_cov_44_565045_g46_i0_p2_ORF_typecomplete_len1818_score260_25Med12/PF09497_10/0_35_NODE_54_length_17501_cov_44_565045_g46_i0895514408